MANNNYKIGYLFFKNLYHKLPDRFSISLDENIIFSNEVINIEDKTWHEWLGLKWNDIKESNAMIRIEVPTNTPEVLDGENQKITELCEKVYIALQLTGDFRVEATNFFTGSRLIEEIRLRQWTTYKDWYCSEYAKRLKNKDMEIWGQLVKKLRFFYTHLSKGNFIRFNRGLINFQKACSELWLDFRLPYFVRSLEALVLPDKGKTEKQFKKRAAKWWPKQFKGDGVGILGQIYDIRCDCEHLHGLKKQYNKTQLLLGHQCEETARNAYREILLNDNELNNFCTDEYIKNYWRQNIN